MRISRATLLSLCVVAAGLGISATKWKTFKSTRYSYTVQYPPSWHLFTNELSPKLDSLDILNFPPSERIHGVVLKKAGAEITVGGSPPGVNTIDEWLHQNLQNDASMEDDDVPIAKPSPNGCTSLRRVVARAEVGEGAYFIHTLYYCSTKTRLYRILLTNWEGDPNQNRLQALALKVALSLRRTMRSLSDLPLGSPHRTMRHLRRV